jgi:hypothetical protein
MDIIISIEWGLSSLSLHVIQIELNKVFTQKVDIIKNQKEMGLIIQNVKERNFNKLVEHFKEKHSLLHCKITISLGPTFRKKLKGEN